MRSPFSFASALSVLSIVCGLAGTARAEALTVARAVEIARAHRSEVAAADVEVQLAGLARVRAALDRVHLTVDGAFSREVERLYVNAPGELCAALDAPCGRTTQRSAFNAAARLSVPIWTGLGLEAAWARAGQLERAARAGKRAVLRTLTLEVVTAYWSVRGAELLEAVARRALERRRGIAASLEARVRAGITPRADLGRMQIAALREEAALAELGGRAGQARAALASAMEIAGPITLADDPPPVVSPPAPARDLVAEALRRRPDLEAAAADVAAQEQTVRVQRGALWPQLGLFGRVEVANEVFGIPQPRAVGDFSAGIALTWLAFDGLATYQAMRAADLERERRAGTRRRLETLVHAEVEAARARLLAALARRPPLTSGRELAQVTVDAVRNRYQAGTALLIEVVQAEDDLRELESDAAINSVELAIAEATLAAAIGRD